MTRPSSNLNAEMQVSPEAKPAAFKCIGNAQPQQNLEAGEIKTSRSASNRLVCFHR